MILDDDGCEMDGGTGNGVKEEGEGRWMNDRRVTIPRAAILGIEESVGVPMSITAICQRGKDVGASELWVQTLHSTYSLCPPCATIACSHLINRTTPAYPVCLFPSRLAKMASCTLRQAKNGKEFPIARSAPAGSMSAVSCGAGRVGMRRCYGGFPKA